MNVVLWIIQILLALLFLFAGVTKLLPIIPLPPPPPDAWIPPMWFLKFIGVCEVLGALGLVLPGLFRRQQHLTVLAAIGLTIIMIGAVVVTVMTMGVAPAVTPLVVGLLCVFVAYGRRGSNR
ncbi:MAG TPA: DoxX family protein [Pyrinomonadaceae bacterium]|nr:DoxX family protein [Pyrinomonadaceae bacterium]